MIRTAEQVAATARRIYLNSPEVLAARQELRDAAAEADARLAARDAQAGWGASMSGRWIGVGPIYHTWMPDRIHPQLRGIDMQPPELVADYCRDYGHAGREQIKKIKERMKKQGLEVPLVRRAANLEKTDAILASHRKAVHDGKAPKLLYKDAFSRCIQTLAPLHCGIA
ncbi:hypothetical protein HDU87_007161 [Geranomyces variabilis]|uniref:Uncharacterized protein n=1 Tax=Geranomyces variabilis TaxID=109894 RepID=A0AAD5TGN9_9FUNG|nr:hypothetical protein HDU87_007161 [Geranomyces variabilis]